MIDDDLTPTDFAESWHSYFEGFERIDPPVPPRRPERVPMVPHTWPVTVWARAVWATVCARLVALLARPRGSGGHFRQRTGAEVWRNLVKPWLRVAVVVVVAVAVSVDIVVWAR